MLHEESSMLLLHVIAPILFSVMPFAAELDQRPYAAPLHAPQFVRASCKQTNSCEEAVALWCGGYSRADADKDGIPCENVCHSLEQVEKIKAQQGC